MKRIGVIAALCLAIGLAGCAREAAGGLDAPTVEKRIYSVGMVMDLGGIQDQSFNQSAWEGLTQLAADTELAVNYLESFRDSDYEPNLEQMTEALENPELIWGIGYFMTDAVLSAAAKHPGVSYGIVDVALEDVAPNLTCVVFRAQEPSFLAGYLAAKTTKTGRVGFMGGMRGEVIDSFEYGYRAGAAYAAKEDGRDVTVDVEYADSFSADEKGKAIALRMYSDGADIVFHAAGGAGIGVINAAKETGKLAIGVDRDQSYLAPDNVMTSALKLVGQAMYDVSLRKHAGEEIGGVTLSYGFAEGACGIPPYEGSTAKLVRRGDYDRAMAIMGRITGGEIDVPFNAETYAAFMNGL